MALCNGPHHLGQERPRVQAAELVGGRAYWGVEEQLSRAGLWDPGQQGWPASLETEIFLSVIARTTHFLGESPSDTLMFLGN